MPAEQQRKHGDHHQQPQLRVDHEPDGERGEDDERADVEEVLAGQHHRRGLDAGRELEVGDDRAGERHGADEDADDDLGRVDAEHALVIQQRGLGSGEIAFDVQVAVPADQHGGQADERVQQCDQLGHAGHLDDLGAPQTDRGTDRHGADQ